MQRGISIIDNIASGLLIVQDCCQPST